MKPHRIRLRDPWEREPLGDGAVRYRRGFHRPRLTGGERVAIVCERSAAAAVVRLNDAPLGEIAAGEPLWQCDVTPLLIAHNILTFDVAGAPADGGLPWLEVRLEIAELP